jgi:hypothetical protein
VLIFESRHELLEFIDDGRVSLNVVLIVYVSEYLCLCFGFKLIKLFNEVAVDKVCTLDLELLVCLDLSEISPSEDLN